MRYMPLSIAHALGGVVSSSGVPLPEEAKKIDVVQKNDRLQKVLRHLQVIHNEKSWLRPNTLPFSMTLYDLTSFFFLSDLPWLSTIVLLSVLTGNHFFPWWSIEDGFMSPTC